MTPQKDIASNTQLADTYQASLTENLIKKPVGFVYFLNKYILC